MRDLFAGGVESPELAILIAETYDSLGLEEEALGHLRKPRSSIQPTRACYVDTEPWPARRIAMRRL